MKILFFIPLIILLSCNTNAIKKVDTISKIDSAAIADSIEASTPATHMFQPHSTKIIDTTGLYLSPIKILKSRIVSKEYSNYKDIALSYKNISDKTIKAIEFAWYGTTAFDEPADMGASLITGLGGGFTEDIIKPGKTNGGTWSISSRNAKNVILAWPTRVVFSDGTKWNLK